MKKNFAALGLVVIAGLAVACNDSSTSATGSDSSSMSSSPSSMSSDSSSAVTNPPPAVMSNTPLSKGDSTFVMKSIAGNMMEVEAGKVAQSNASSQRLKDYGAMLVRDHTMAGDQAKAFATSHGMTVPSALPADKQAHVDAMQKMTGKSFDSHFTSMMIDDHKKDISEYQKASTSSDNADLKTWAGNTLPTLQAHLDSIQAIKKSM